MLRFKANAFRSLLYFDRLKKNICLENYKIIKAAEYLANSFIID